MRIARYWDPEQRPPATASSKGDVVFAIDGSPTTKFASARWRAPWPACSCSLLASRPKSHGRTQLHRTCQGNRPADSARSGRAAEAREHAHRQRGAHRISAGDQSAGIRRRTGVVIRRKMRNVAPDDVPRHVLGYAPATTSRRGTCATTVATRSSSPSPGTRSARSAPGSRRTSSRQPRPHRARRRRIAAERQTPAT